MEARLRKLGIGAPRFCEWLLPTTASFSPAADALAPRRAAPNCGSDARPVRPHGGGERGLLPPQRRRSHHHVSALSLDAQSARRWPTARTLSSAPA
eukprot:1807373-Prymnesium_polylepis.1